MKITAILSVILSILLSVVLLFSCSREETETGTEIVKKTSTETAPDPVIMDQDIVQDMEEEIVADFTVTLGTHENGEALLDSLTKNHFRVSKWSMQVLTHRNFPVEAEEQQVDVIVMSLLEMGFLQDELVSLDTTIKRAKKLGFEVCTPELAAQLRLQYTDQPDWSTGDRLGQFFVATEAIDLYADGVPKIFSIIRDDAFPHKETGIGLWLISNNVVDAADQDRRARLFNPADQNGDDLGGRFAFIIPSDE
ncbi:MAG: hypothetical protein OXU36_09070 [Candidatus Poribacteria bacterium]|nr:hypothetical protein [Candidatus Poribacteria bacterium]